MAQVCGNNLHRLQQSEKKLKHFKGNNTFEKFPIHSEVTGLMF